MPWPGGRGGTLSASRVLLHITVSDPEVQGTFFFLSFLTYCCTQSPADRGPAISGPLKTGVSVRASIMQVRCHHGGGISWSTSRPAWLGGAAQEYKTKKVRLDDVGFVGFMILLEILDMLINFQITL